MLTKIERRYRRYQADLLKQRQEFDAINRRRALRMPSPANQRAADIDTARALVAEGARVNYLWLHKDDGPCRNERRRTRLVDSLDARRREEAAA